MKIRTPLASIRQSCLDCSETRKMVMWCPCDGVHSTWCPSWPYRFGMRPETARKKYGRRLLTPELMPDANIHIDDLPANPAELLPGSAPGAEKTEQDKPSREPA